MIDLLNTPIIRCDKCGEEYTIPQEIVEFDTSCYERNMGTEIEYTFEDEYICRCGNHIKFLMVGNEYPEGAYDSQVHQSWGGHFIEEPLVGMVYPCEEFDVDCAFEEYDHVKNLITQISKNPELIYDISPREFEEIVERVFRDNGFETSLTKETRDGGKDIIATRYIMGKPVVYYIECKKYGRKKKIDVSIVRSLFGVQTSDRVNKSIIVTTAHFSPDARSFADDQNTLIDLMDIDEFYGLLKRSAETY